MNSSKKTKYHGGRIFLVLLLLFLSVAPGEYYIRWIVVLALAVVLGVILVGADVRINYLSKPEEYTGRKRPDFERALLTVKRAKKGGGKDLIEEDLLEVYHILTGKSYRELRSNPPPALKFFYSSPNTYEGLKGALKLLEDELNED
ncbi:hypothetical protein [Thermococcus sp.]|uniref:hypothetical protein n=1 Tax=Thermococcus sp. TaxID=35749 RepID=UPI0025EF1615|nr:hypothetical protein [Thermococcus sp.]